MESVMSNHFGIEWGYIIYKLEQFFFMNFSWLIFGCIVALFAIWGAGKLKRLRASDRQEAGNAGYRKRYAGLCGGMAAFIIFSLIYVTSSLYRYNIIAAVILSIVFIIIMQKTLFEKQDRLIWLFSGVVLLAFVVQSFWDIDPVSNAVFGTIETGGKEKLYSAYQEGYYGDGLVNNYQYTWIDKLLNQMLAEVDFAEDMDVVLPGMEASGLHVNGNGSYYVIGWDKEKEKRVMIDEDILENNPEIIELSIQRTDDIIGKLPWDYSGFSEETYENLKNRAVVFFLPYYGENEGQHTNALGQYYYVGEREQQENTGGKIYYYRLMKKDHYMGFSVGDFIEGKGCSTQPLEVKTYEERLLGSLDRRAYETGKSVIDIGDEVSFTYEAYINGEPLPDRVKDTYYGDTYSVVIGSRRMIEGIEESLIGKSPGDTVEFEWNVPDTYLPALEYAGETIVFELHINSILGYKDIVNISEEGVRKNMSEYTNYLTQTLDRNMCNVCIDTVNGGEVDVNAYPPEAQERINRHIQAIEQYMDQYLESAGITEKQFIEIYLESNDREYRSAIRDMAHAAMLFENMKEASLEEAS